VGRWQLFTIEPLSATLSVRAERSAFHVLDEILIPLEPEWKTAAGSERIDIGEEGTESGAEGAAKRTQGSSIFEQAMTKYRAWCEPYPKHFFADKGCC
jgi:hypothetical protein